MTEARYAIYLAPGPETALWSFGSRVLGYDAETGATLAGFTVPGIDAAQWRALTERPRMYGFHATLKAPFRLAAGASRAELVAALEAVAAAHDSFDLGALGVRALADPEGNGFAALTLMAPSPPLERLEQDVVQSLDRFRAPLTAAELAKRHPERLTERQRAALERYGYPFIGPDYLFHMTLTGEMAGICHVADLLADAVANAVGGAHLTIHDLALFEQPKPGARFRVTHRAPLRDAHLL